MKVSITYFSQTGNTEKVARAICEEISQTHEVAFKTLDEAENQPVGACDLFVLGTPIHSNGLPAPVNEFLAKLDQSPKFKMAAFVTHMSDTYQTDAFGKGIAAIQQLASEKGITFLGTFDCQGKLAEPIQAVVQKTRNIPADVWQAKMDETNKHPDLDDLSKARVFAKEILAK